MSEVSPEGGGGVNAQRTAVYGKLRSLVDEDALHDLIAKHGPAILDREFPYLVVAARNQLRGRLRRTAREAVGIPEQEGASIIDSSAGPEAQTVQKATYRSLIRALAALEDADALLIWRQAEGVPDEEVLTEEVARGLMPPSFNKAALRKRRERARKRLRNLLEPRGPEAME